VGIQDVINERNTMSTSKGVISNIVKRKKQDEKNNENIEKKNDELKMYVVQYEQERYKTEVNKQHDRYRKNQKQKGYSVNIPVHHAKKIVTRPGTYFYGPLSKLAKDFKTIEEMSKYFTAGQLIKYQECSGRLWNLKTNQMVYDPETGECNE
tara:strand:- start:7611 stop:8066 length:456 start_codon:yes stop_codon:yes gene_type:complete